MPQRDDDDDMKQITVAESSSVPANDSCDIQLFDKVSGKPVPLKSIHFAVDVHKARTCLINMTQTYENLGSKGLDVTFYYPVDTNFAMSKIVI